MNRNRMLIGAAVAILIGLLASHYVYRKIQLAMAMTPVQTRQLVVASQDLPLGARLGPQQLEVISWPSNTPLAGGFSKIQDCEGRALITPISKNEPILEDKLAPKEAGVGLPAAIPEGMRAVSVRVDDVVGVAGFVLPGTAVDVLVTGSPQNNPNQSVTRTILENVRVMAAGQKVEHDKEGKPQTVSVVTLLVNPEQANALTMGSTEGKLHLALRNVIDLKTTNPPPVFETALLLGGAPVAAPRAGKRVVVESKPKPAPTYAVEVIRGDKRETQTFPTQSQAQ